MTREQAGNEFHGVQALRAIAALAVVAGHSTDYLLLVNGAVPGPLRWVHGPAGVDIFFVISGFVMMLSAGRLRELPHPGRVFLWRRVLRILPLYWLLKLVAITAHPGLSVHGRPSAGNVTASLLFVPSLNAEGLIRPLIPLGWTLSFEMLFYLIFAVALSVRGGWLRVLVPAICALAGIGAMRSETWPAWTSLADPIVLEFLAGVGVAGLVLRGDVMRGAKAAGLLVMGFAGLVLLVPSAANPLLRPLVWGVPAAAIVLGAAGLEAQWGRRVPGWLLLLGSASYSIYLVQTFVFPVVHAVFARRGLEFVHGRPIEAGVIMMAMSLVATSAAGVGTYLVVERPMTQLLKARLGAVRIAPIAR